MKDFKRILLAEDSAADAELTMEALSEYNLANRVDLVRDGTEVLDYLHRRGPYSERAEGLPLVLFLDLKMPKMDGLELLGILKADAAFRRMPVVMLTSSREESDLVESYRLGANAYVVKPVDFAQFTEAIRKLGIFWALVNQPPPDTP